MKKIIFTIAFSVMLTTVIFAQSKKETKIKSISDSSILASPPDTITGSYFSLEQGKMIEYKTLISKEEIKNITNCKGWDFKDSEGKTIAYTPCKDYSFKSLVVIDKDKFIEYLRVNQLSLR